MSSTYRHGRPQEFFQGGQTFGGGPQKICEGGPHIFWTSTKICISGGGVVLMRAEFFSRGPQIY